MMSATINSGVFGRRHIFFYNDATDGAYLGVVSISAATLDLLILLNLIATQGFQGSLFDVAHPAVFDAGAPPGQVYVDPAAGAAPGTTFWQGALSPKTINLNFRTTRILIPPGWSLLADVSALTQTLDASIRYVVVSGTHRL
jgi:hypothetical protein